NTAGRPAARTSPLGQTSRSSYDALGQLVRAVDALGDATSFAYDPNGNLLSLTDALGHITSYAYDAMDRATSRTDPLGHAETYQEAAGATPPQVTDRKGQVSNSCYDALGRRIAAAFGATGAGCGGSAESTLAYTYDRGNRLTQAVDSLAGTIGRSYDNRNR